MKMERKKGLSLHTIEKESGCSTMVDTLTTRYICFIIFAHSFDYYVATALGSFLIASAPQRR